MFSLVELSCLRSACRWCLSCQKGEFVIYFGYPFSFFFKIRYKKEKYIHVICHKSQAFKNEAPIIVLAMQYLENLLKIIQCI
jgi:hypothetical protein